MAGKKSRLVIGFENLARQVSNQNRIDTIFEQVAIAFAGHIQALEQFRILDGCPGERTQPGQHQQGIGIEGLGKRVENFQNANDFPLNVNRGASQRADPHPGDFLVFIQQGFRSHGRDDDPALLARDQPGNSSLEFDPFANQAFPRFAGSTKNNFLACNHAEGGDFNLERLLGLSQDAFINIIQPHRLVQTGRAFGQGSHHPRLALTFRKQARIQDKNPGLVGNRLHQLEMFIVVSFRNRVNQGQHPDHFFASHERDADRRFCTRAFHQVVFAAQPA